MAAPRGRKQDKENSPLYSFETPKKKSSELQKPLPATRQSRLSDSSDGSDRSSSDSSDEEDSNAKDSDNAVNSIADGLAVVDLSSDGDDGKESRLGGHHRTPSFAGRLKRFNLKDHHLKEALRECKNTCPISGLPFPSGKEGNKYHLDHDHALENTGLPIQFSVRGPLSPGMNRGLGKNIFNDSPVRLARAISFLRRPKFKSHLHGIIASQGTSSDAEALAALGSEVDWRRLLRVYQKRQKEEAELNKILHEILRDEAKYNQELSEIINVIRKKIRRKATEDRNKKSNKEISNKKNSNKGKSTKDSDRD